MEMTRETVREEIRARVAELAERDTAEITDTASFADELGFDSLMGIELVVGLEMDFGVRVPDDEIEKVDSLDETVALVMEHLPDES